MLAISDAGGAVPGAHVTLRKPVTLDSGTESVKAAYSRMLLDYRLNARYAVMAHVTARDETDRSFSVTVTDLGDGGAGIRSKEQLAVGNVLSLSVHLPETPLPLNLQARVVWTREYGTAGCEIVSMPPVDREILRDWLKARTRVKKPLISV